MSFSTVCPTECHFNYTCACCDVTFACMCKLHHHILANPNIKQYSVHIETSTVEVIIHASDHSDRTLDNVYSPCKTLSVENIDDCSNEINEHVSEESYSLKESACNKGNEIGINSQKGDADFKTVDDINTTCYRQKGEDNMTLDNLGNKSSDDRVSKQSDDNVSHENDDSFSKHSDDNIAKNSYISQSGKSTEEVVECCSSDAGHDANTKEIMTSTDKVPCDICGHMFKKRNLKRHREKHTEIKQYPCDICEKKFKTQSQLYSHKLHHNSEKVYTCHFCGKSFNNGPNLRQHIKTHTREKTLPCPVCNKLFASNYILKDHMLRHSDEKPHSCLLCHRVFRKPQELKRHMVMHTDTRNHPCSQCNKAFKTRSNRIKHEKTHTRK